MSNWSLSLRKNKDTKDKSAAATAASPPKAKPTPRRASTSLADALTRNGSTRTLENLKNESSTSLAPSATVPTRSRTLLQSGKQLFTRNGSSRRPSLMNMKQTASPAASSDDLSLPPGPVIQPPVLGSAGKGKNANVKSGIPILKDSPWPAASRRRSGSSTVEQPIIDSQPVSAATQAPAAVSTPQQPEAEVTATIQPPIVTEEKPSSEDSLSAPLAPPPASYIDVAPTAEQPVQPNTVVVVSADEEQQHEDAIEPEETSTRVVPDLLRLTPPDAIFSASILSPVTEEPLTPARDVPPSAPVADEKAAAVTAPPPPSDDKLEPTAEPLPCTITEEVENEDPSRQPDSARSSWTLVSPPSSPMSEVEKKVPVNILPGGLNPEDLSVFVSKAQPPPPQQQQPQQQDPKPAFVPMTMTTSVASEDVVDSVRRFPFITHSPAPSVRGIGGSRDDRRARNILFFGDTGSGKSSVINMLMGTEVVGISGAAEGMTLGGQSYITTIDGQRLVLWDTSGLNEVEGGTVPARMAMRNVRDLVGALKDGVSLLVYCIRATRFRASLKVNYDLIAGTICEARVPVLVVVTGLENQVPREEWWKENGAQFEEHGMVFEGHACVTATRGKMMRAGGYLYEREFGESSVELREMVRAFFAVERTSWVIENKEVWAAETSKRMDVFYAAKEQMQQGGDKADGKGSAMMTPRTQTWWEYLVSYWYGAPA